MEPKVTYVITNYNYGRYLEQAIQSLLLQTFHEIEVIVVDDNSTDRSGEVLERYVNHDRVIVVRHQQNLGNRYGDNEGIALARGEYVGTLDADDFALQLDVVGRQVDLLDDHEDMGFVYTAYNFVDESGTVYRQFRPWPTDYVQDGLTEFAQLINGNYISHSGTLARGSFLRSIGGYDVAMPFAGDFDLWLRMCTRYSVGYLSDALYAYRIHRASMSRAGVSPHTASGELARAVARGFDSLPATAPLELRRRRGASIRLALLATSWGDRSHGRTRRSWEGLVDAALRDPGMVVTREFNSALGKLMLQTILGFARYERLSAWRSRDDNRPPSPVIHD